MWYALALEFCRRGHEVLYISRTYPGMPDEEWLEGIHHKRVPGYDWPGNILQLKWLDLRYTLRAKKVIPEDADVVVTNTFWSPILLNASLRRRCFVDVARVPKGQMRLYPQAARLRANSSPVAAAIKKELPLVQHHRVVCIPNPLPFQDLPQIDLTTKKPQILYTGRLHPEKGIDLLLRAFRGIGRGWKLKIVGPWEKNAGGGGEAYMDYLKDLAGGCDVEFTGAIHDAAQLNKCYAEASIFVYPSVAEKGETFGLSPLEAMSWGCATIVSDLACFKDFLIHEYNGLVFNHRSEHAVTTLQAVMARLIGEEHVRNRLAERALQVRKSHSTAFIAKLFLEEFEQITELHRPAKALSL